MDLSTLTTPELRQVLRLARGRGDGLLIDRVNWELAERSALSTRIGAPIETLMAEPPEPVATERMTFADGEPLRLRGHEPPPPPRARTREPAPASERTRGLPMLAAGIIAGSLFGGGVFVGANGLPPLPVRVEFAAHAPKAEAPKKPPKKKPVQVATAKPRHLTPVSSDGVAGVLAPEPFPPMPQAEPEPAPPAAAPAPTPAPPAAEAPAPRLHVEVDAPVVPPPTTEPEAPPKAKVEKAARKEPKQLADTAEAAKKEPAKKVELAKADLTPRDPCVAKATKADRAVCSDGSLRLFDRDLRRAYAQAQRAGVTEKVLLAGETSWRRTRDRTSDPDRLARLYDQRIRELAAATKAARARD